MAAVTFELYGIARRRAGLEEVRVPPGTFAQALRALERAAPALAGEVLLDGRLAPHWRAALDGTRFVEGPDTPLPPGSRVVLLSSLAGG